MQCPFAMQRISAAWLSLQSEIGVAQGYHDAAYKQRRVEIANLARDHRMCARLLGFPTLHRLFTSSACPDPHLAPRRTCKGKA